jgi:hypothetical protein
VIQVARAMQSYAEKRVAEAVRAEREAWRPHAYSNGLKCSCGEPLPNKHPFTVCDPCWDRARGEVGKT